MYPRFIGTFYIILHFTSIRQTTRRVTGLSLGICLRHRHLAFVTEAVIVFVSRSELFVMGRGVRGDSDLERKPLNFKLDLWPMASYGLFRLVDYCNSGYNCIQSPPFS